MRALGVARKALCEGAAGVFAEDFGNGGAIGNGIPSQREGCCRLKCGGSPLFCAWPQTNTAVGGYADG